MPQALALENEKQLLKRYYQGQQMESPNGGFLMSLGIRSGVGGDAQAIFECSVSSLRYQLTIPKATRAERRKVKDGGEKEMKKIRESAQRELDRLEEIWNTNPLLRQYLGTIGNPDLIVYRIEPSRVRYKQEFDRGRDSLAACIEWALDEMLP